MIVPRALPRVYSPTSRFGHVGSRPTWYLYVRRASQLSTAAEKRTTRRRQRSPRAQLETALLEGFARGHPLLMDGAPPPRPGISTTWPTWPTWPSADVIESDVALPEQIALAEARQIKLAGAPLVGPRSGVGGCSWWQDRRYQQVDQAWQLAPFFVLRTATFVLENGSEGAKVRSKPPRTA